jgi:von Willebrand factor type A C-terminal domain/von Willebrand factor type A domain
VTTFNATVHQNVYLPRGETVVHAIVAFSAEELDWGFAPGGVPSSDAVEVIMLDCSASMAVPPSKLEGAQTATCKAIDKLRDGTWFAIVAGTSFARLVYPPQRFEQASSLFSPSLARATTATRAAAKEAVRRLQANGGTSISSWLALARRLFESMPEAIHHAILLADGKNESEEGAKLVAELQRCAGKFECDCVGVGTDWERAELQAISDALLGSTDIVPHIWQMDGMFESITEKAMRKRVGSVALQVLTPLGAGVHFVKQVSPEVLNLSDKVTWRQPYGRDAEWRTVQAVDPDRPLLSIYPTGAWARGEEREYHICLSVEPQEVGTEHEVRAGRVSLVVDGTPVTQVPVRALWTDDAEKSTRINRAVAHYTGQEELAASIEQGLEARRVGDYKTATQKLGRAAHLAHMTGNEPSTRLLQRVVQIEDPERGVVQLKAEVSKEDEMTLDTRSRRTVRLRKSQAP